MLSAMADLVRLIKVGKALKKEPTRLEAPKATSSRLGEIW
jgi:hypothetical protein